MVGRNTAIFTSMTSPLRGWMQLNTQSKKSFE